MTLRAIISFMILLLVTPVIGQTHTLTGKVINEEFSPLPFASIFNADTELLGKTDLNGDFNITIPSDLKVLAVATVGMEWKRLDLLSDCNNLEIILQSSSTYDFISPARQDRLRKKQFNKLSALHKSAFEIGVFKADRPCYIDEFISYKNEAIERHKVWKRKRDN